VRQGDRFRPSDRSHCIRCCLKAESLEKCGEAMVKLAKSFVQGEVSEEELYQKRDELLKDDKATRAHGSVLEFAKTSDGANALTHDARSILAALTTNIVL
jgi:hypothetical protein